MKNSDTNGGLFFSVVFIVFLVSKLSGVINWPWIWVFSPVWIPLAVVFFMILFLGAVGFLEELK